jgi:hypothetical protein
MTSASMVVLCAASAASAAGAAAAAARQHVGVHVLVLQPLKQRCLLCRLPFGAAWLQCVVGCQPHIQISLLTAH